VRNQNGAYHQGIIEVQNVIFIHIKCLVLDGASYGVEFLANLVCFVLTTGDLEPAVVVVVSKLGILLPRLSE
jgi:hypothetical protein